MPSRSANLESVNAPTVWEWLDRGDAVLIDVREDREFAAEHIAEARHIALSTFDASDLPEIEDRVVVYYCLSGRRTTDFADELAVAAATARKAYQMDGGIEAWKAAGLPTRLGSLAFQLPDRARSVTIAADA